MSKPITIWVTPAGPNPWKVVQLAEELKIPYHIKSITFQETKFSPYIDLNPNGRVPAVEDPNTGITLWESGAIIIYLIEQYDTTNSLSYGPDSPTHRHHCNQWLMFQLSGQGPYFGQLAWFVNFHPEKLPSVQERYSKELHRVLGVLETALQANGGGVLVGDKLTYADLAFVWWNEMTQIAAGTAVDPLEGFPGVLAWHKRMKDRDSFKKTAEVRTAAMKEQQLGATGLKQGQTVQDLEAEVAKQKQ